MSYQTQYVPAYTNHLLHLILSLATFGLWFPVWVLVWMVNHNRTVPKQVLVPVAPYQSQYPLSYQSHTRWPDWGQQQPSLPVPPQAP